MAEKKQKVERYEFDGTQIELRQVPPCRRDAPENSHMHGPAQRSKWEIYVDGVHLGFAFYPLGVNNPWLAATFEPKDILDYNDNEGVRCWEGPKGEHGGWDETCGKWDGLLGLLRKVESPEHLRRRGGGWAGFRDRAGVAEGFYLFWKKGEVLDPAGVVGKMEREKQRRADRKREDAERTERYARERVEREARQKLEADEAERLRQETLEGLIDLRTKLQERRFDEIGNFEIEALSRAMKKYGFVG